MKDGTLIKLSSPTQARNNLMASRQTTIDFILEQIADAGAVSAKKMFGEYGIYCDGKMVALVCDDQLFVKPTESGRSFIGNITEGVPYPGAKAYFLITGDKWDNRNWLSELIRISATELPVPQKKTPRKK